jgi:hypothetical protein
MEKVKRGIRIKVEKIEQGVGRFVKILEIHALNKDQLPEEYKLGMHVRQHFRNEKRLLHRNSEGGTLYALLLVGQVIPADVFCEYMKIIKQCGERLGEINRKNRKEKKDHQRLCDAIFATTPLPRKPAKRIWAGEKEYTI